MSATTTGAAGSVGRVYQDSRAVTPPIEFRACVVCGNIYNVDAMSECACGRYECSQHTCDCDQSIRCDPYTGKVIEDAA
jgi:hypothetical protein